MRARRCHSVIGEVGVLKNALLAAFRTKAGLAAWRRCLRAVAKFNAASLNDVVMLMCLTFFEALTRNKI